MRKSLISGAITALAVGGLFVPATAQAATPTASASVNVLAHGSASHTAVVNGHYKPGTHIAVAGMRTATAHSLAIDYQVQQTGYWCGPASTRIALSARESNPPTQATLASQLGTTTDGTDYIGQVTTVLNADLGTGWYETKDMPNDPPTQAQKDLLSRDVHLDIDNGYAIVANIVAPPGNQPPGYPSGETIYHYFTVIGYDDSNNTVLIGDPANFSGNQIYWLSFDQLATLIPPKGYSA